MNFLLTKSRLHSFLLAIYNHRSLSAMLRYDLQQEESDGCSYKTKEPVTRIDFSGRSVVHNVKFLPAFQRLTIQVGEICSCARRVEEKIGGIRCGGNPASYGVKLGVRDEQWGRPRQLKR